MEQADLPAPTLVYLTTCVWWLALTAGGCVALGLASGYALGRKLERSLQARRASAGAPDAAPPAPDKPAPAAPAEPAVHVLTEEQTLAAAHLWGLAECGPEAERYLYLARFWQYVGSTMPEELRHSRQTLDNKTSKNRWRINIER